MRWSGGVPHRAPPGPSPSRWPLGWLLARAHPLTNPRRQAAWALAVALILSLCLGSRRLVDWLMDHDDAAFLWLAVLPQILSCAFAWLSAAGQVAGAKEAKTWESVASTSRSSGMLLLDLVRGSLCAGLVPFIVSGLLLSTWAVLAAETEPPSALALGLIASLGSAILLVALVGTAASLSSRNAGPALSLSAAALVAIPGPTLVLLALSHLVPEGALLAFGLASWACALWACLILVLKRTTALSTFVGLALALPLLLVPLVTLPLLDRPEEALPLVSGPLGSLIRITEQEHATWGDTFAAAAAPAVPCLMLALAWAVTFWSRRDRFVGRAA